MKQSKLMNKVKQIFKDQDFNLTLESKDKLQAESEENKMQIHVFSSEKYSQKHVMQKKGEDDLIFLDEGLEELAEDLETETSILTDKEEEEVLEPPSYERIGKVIIIKELNNMKPEEAVKAIRNHNPDIRSILVKTGKREGEFRLGEYKKIFGDKTETIHKEHGVKIKVDPTKAFFSEKEGTERKRVFKSVEAGEKILVMFCGAAPFPVTIAKNAEPSKVIGVEKNPEAVSYAQKNIKINNVNDKVNIIKGDVSNICPELGGFDRVLMPSPTNSLEYIEEALNCTKNNGNLTVYSVENKNKPYNRVVEKVKAKAIEENMKAKEAEKRIVADFSPSKRKVAVEFNITN